MRVVLTGGGTAGHVMPFEPLIESLRTLYLEQKDNLPKAIKGGDLQISFMGVADKNIRELFWQYDVPVAHVPSGKIRRYASFRNMADLLFRLPWGVAVALWRMYWIMPDVIISKGGYASVPVILSALWYRIPILLHESDVVPGFANSSAVRFATAITAGFPGMKHYLPQYTYKIFVTGTPVRPGIRAIQSSEAKKIFEIPGEEKTLLVMGGSQGAQQINEALLKILPEIIVDFSIIHITGQMHYEAVSTVAKELIAHSPRAAMYKPFAYLSKKMRYALGAADGVVSRAGASSLAEIAALRKPALLIPLDGAANDHQRKNARAFEAAGAAIVLDPTNLGKNIFKQNIMRIMADGEAREALSHNIEQMDFPKAARDIAALAFKLAKGFVPKKSEGDA